MTLERFQLLRNVGQFDSVNAGAQLPLMPLTLIYAENGRGKTTLAAILKSLSSGNGALIEDRHRLGAQHPPHIVLAVGGGQIQYQNGAWTASLPNVAVFDDAFVAANICSGIELATSHRQHLHELILGARGVALNETLQGHVAAIEQHNRDLRAKEQAIPATLRMGLSVDEFCSLQAVDDIDTQIQEAERAVAAATAADEIRRREGFQLLDLPMFDLDGISGLLMRTLPDLQAEAADMIRDHLRQIGNGGEQWIGDGMKRVEGLRLVGDGDTCPFCAQDLEASPLIRHYEAYFSQAYRELKQAINDAGRGIGNSHGGNTAAAFERSIRVSRESRDFWRRFMDVPEIDVDTAVVVRDWTAARDGLLTILRAKAAAPLEAIALDPEVIQAVEAYHAHATAIGELFGRLTACNAQVEVVKQQAADANLAALAANLDKLRATKARHTAPLSTACDEYLAEKAAKVQTEGLREQARAALDNYRQNIFPNYERAINEYLVRFNAGFRLGSVRSVNTRGGSSADYNVIINNVPVGLNANSGPSFRTTLSAGDRNTLALAFFFASLEQEPDLDNKIVIIDDPMTSLDEHRSMMTIGEVRRLIERVRQVIVLSHSKSFLCEIWEGADGPTSTALRISRDGVGSTLTAWDVNRDSITEHDHRHALVRGYIVAADPAIEREVAQALRHILEKYLRVAYPERFPPGSLIGHFLNVCRQRQGGTDQVLNAGDIAELQSLLDFANRFHHDTNEAYQTAAINDQELLGFARRTLRFTSRDL